MNAILQNVEASDRATMLYSVLFKQNKKAGAQDFDDERAQKAHLQVGVVVDDILALDAIVHDRRTKRLKRGPETRHRCGNILSGRFRQQRRKAVRRAHGFEESPKALRGIRATFGESS